MTKTQVAQWRRLSTLGFGLPGKTDYLKRRYELAWRMLSPHARQFIGGGRGEAPPADGFLFSGMISFRIHGGQQAQTDS